MDENKDITLEWNQAPEAAEEAVDTAVDTAADAATDAAEQAQEAMGEFAQDAAQTGAEAAEYVEGAVEEAAEEAAGEFAQEAPKKEGFGKKFVEGFVKMTDKNGDGKFDFADIAAAMGGAGAAMKKGVQAVKDSNDEKTRQQDLKMLRPIFLETLDNADFNLPRFISLVDRSRKYIESAACQGSIGYEADIAGLHLVNVFRDTQDAFKLTFWPDGNQKYYYRDTVDRNKYIALDFYFTYMRDARIGELDRLSDALGAKHAKITFKKEQTRFIAATQEEGTEKLFSAQITLVDKDGAGHTPVRPILRYLEREPELQNLIRTRMEGYEGKAGCLLKLSDTLGLKMEDAKAVEKFLKEIEQPGNTTLVSEVKNEERRYLELELEF